MTRHFYHDWAQKNSCSMEDIPAPVVVTILPLVAHTPSDSPLLRRPDLLRSLITYWQHHPGLILFIFRCVYRPYQPGAAY